MTPRAPLPVVFSHIPKTAGSTTYGLLVRNYGSGLYPAYGPHREMIKEGLTQARPGGPITCIAGHQPLGTYSSEFRRLVIFRDPVARLRSMHAYLRRQKGYENDETWEAATNYPLSEYTAADPLSTWNAQVRFAAGRNDPVASDDTGALEAALANLSEPNVSMGVLDLLPESLYLAGRDLGWHRHYFLPRNVAPKKSKAPTDRTGSSAATAGDEAALQSATGLDQQLVDWARQRVLTRVAELSADELADLERYRSRLAMLGRLARPIPQGRARWRVERHLP